MADTTHQLPGGAQPGRRIGPYQLLELIGQGGMGEVWLAEQREPMRRKVALKLIRTGQSSREILARFGAERQALALMEHPNIARVLDAGEHEGAPYFVMEYVRGVPINEYCDREKLSIDQRLRLFQQICEAVQHAHQKAVVHRDLKPSNILVTEQDGTVVSKVIDFGVAKATAQPLTEITFHTQVGQLLGTPLYMSPEQADSRSQDVDTRSDVYSLGVILYELLTGTLPFDSEELAEAGYEGMLKVLRERNPARPSTRVSTLDENAEGIATARGLKPRTLRSDLSGDLDWITMRCLEKDRKQRYPGPGDLSRDIERHLRLEVVDAGPPSLRYRLDRLVRRNRALVAVASTILLAIVLVAVVSVVQSQRIAEQRDLALYQSQRAEQEARRAEAAHLYTLGIHEENSSHSLAYAIASLELADQDHVRRLALKNLQSGPTFHDFWSSEAPGNPWAVDISPDGRWVAVGWGGGGLLRLFPADGGDPISLEGHEGFVFDLQFTPDSSRLISCASDMEYRLWSVPQGDLLHRIEVPPGDWTQFRILEDGRTAILGHGLDGDDWYWSRWDLTTNQHEVLARWKPDGPQHAWGAPDVDPRGRWVVRGRDETIFLVPLDALEGSDEIRVGRHAAPFYAARFSPDGDRMVTVDTGGEVRVWDTEIDPPRILRVHRVEGTISTLSFDRAGDRYSVGCQGQGLQVFDLRHPVGAEPLQLQNAQLQWGFQMVEHPRQPWILMTSTHLQVGAWQFDDQVAIVLRPERSPGYLAFTPDGEHLVIEAKGCILLWPLSHEAVSEPECIYDLPGANMRALGVDRSGGYVFVGMGDGSAGNGTVALIGLDGSPPWVRTEFSNVFRVCVDAGASLVAAFGNAGAMGSRTRIWDRTTGTHRDLGVDGDPRVIPSGFTEGGKLLLFSKNSIALADLATGEREALRDSVEVASILEDGRTLHWKDLAGVDWVEDLRTGEQTNLPHPPEGTYFRALDPVHRWIATGNFDGTVELISFDGERRQVFLGHEGPVNGVAIDPRGRWVASASEDGTVRLWPITWKASILDLPYSDLLPYLRSRTTMRARPDSTLVNRYSISNVPFVGWRSSVGP